MRWSPLMRSPWSDRDCPNRPRSPAASAARAARSPSARHNPGTAGGRRWGPGRPSSPPSRGSAPRPSTRSEGRGSPSRGYRGCRSPAWCGCGRPDPSGYGSSHGPSACPRWHRAARHAGSSAQRRCGVRAVSRARRRPPSAPAGAVRSRQGRPSWGSPFRAGTRCGGNLPPLSAQSWRAGFSPYRSPRNPGGACRQLRMLVKAVRN